MALFHPLGAAKPSWVLGGSGHCGPFAPHHFRFCFTEWVCVCVVWKWVRSINTFYVFIQFAHLACVPLGGTQPIDKMELLVEMDGYRNQVKYKSRFQELISFHLFCHPLQCFNTKPLKLNIRNKRNILELDSFSRFGAGLSSTSGWLKVWVIITLYI